LFRDREQSRGIVMAAITDDRLPVGNTTHPDRPPPTGAPGDLAPQVAKRSRPPDRPSPLTSGSMSSAGQPSNASSETRRVARVTSAETRLTVLVQARRFLPIA
jgi:hypothetical protein